MEVDRLIDLINDILKLSELESVTIDQSEERCDVLEVAKDTVDLLTPLRQDGGVTLSVAGQSATVAVPQGRMKELLLNLVSNGIKYTEKGGRVDVSVRPQGSQVAVTVKDNGIGIPEEAQGRGIRAVLPGGQGPGPQKRRHRPGPGHRQAHHPALYGGTVALESEVGKGSAFTVTLPLARD